MNFQYFDAHTHMNFAAYKDDYRKVIRRALDLGIGIINVGTQADTSRRAVEIAHEFDGEPVYSAVGLHPIHTEQSYHDPDELGGNGDKGFTSRGEEFDYEYYKNLASGEKVVAIGECGLDYYRFKNGDSRFKNKQKDAFIKQIELASDVKKPLMIHCRNAFPDLIELLNAKRYALNTNPGIIHFFSGTIEDAKKLLALGFYFTFGGVITFTRDYDEVVTYIPLDRILSETDAPYVTPVPHRGKRNEPAYVVEVVKKIAEIKNVPLEDARAAILENAQKFLPQ